mgnify:CR=1 FL=1
MEIAPFLLSRTLVSQGEFLAFVEDGGYTQPEFWSVGGKYWLRKAARSCPADAGEATPYRAGVPFAEGVLWTAAFTVALPP